VDNALVASWVRQGLPSDPTSVQNGTILTNSERWPLMMDPQLQGVVWIKERESKNNLQVRCCMTQGGTQIPSLHW
jgi:dynein heavy chain